MPKESVTRKKAIQILSEGKWVCWCPKKVKFHESDVFGIVDLLALKGNRQKNIQLTTLPNVSAKRKKITNFLKKHRVVFPVEIWGWDKKKKKFKKERVCLKIRKRGK
jgi:hypothetical protein